MHTVHSCSLRSGLMFPRPDTALHRLPGATDTSGCQLAHTTCAQLPPSMARLNTPCFMGHSAQVMSLEPPSKPWWLICQRGGRISSDGSPSLRSCSSYTWQGQQSQSPVGTSGTP